VIRTYGSVRGRGRKTPPTRSIRLFKSCYHIQADAESHVAADAGVGSGSGVPISANGDSFT
jgi:hypothetical protein